MREIKFRAWDTERKKMFVPFELRQKLNQRLGEFGESIIFLQYTGLKDKNGKEIYEGDIVEVNTELQTGVKKQVIYKNDYACFVLATKETECGILQETASKYYKVIGNIYENPELLGKED